jgi:hypothetical protein
MQNLSLLSAVERPFNHDGLYQFWSRSQGLWSSKLAKVSVRLLDEQELQTLQHIHSLERPDFGIRMAWEYQSKSDIGQMMWCVDAYQPNSIFADQSVAANTSPAVYGYHMIEGQTLITTNGQHEERTTLDGDSRRVRELRSGGRLVKRLWENKFSA